MEEEILHRVMHLHRESEEVEQQINFVNEQVSDLTNFNSEIKFLSENSESEILASIGKGVYISTDPKKRDNKLFVDVGAGVILRKTPKEAVEIIGSQINKFNHVKLQLKTQLENYASQFKEIVEEIEKLKSKQN